MQKRSLSRLALALLMASGITEAKNQTFVHGQPVTVVCAVMHVCDIELQAGEYLTDDIKVGDPAHWSITPAITESPGGEIHHLVVRPLDIDVETSLVVLTNKRTYHISLKSDLNRYMPRVTFSYPDEERRELKDRINKEVEARKRSQIPGTAYFIGDLDFDYVIDGEPSLKPLRVFNNGIKTTIELSQSPAPQSKPMLVVPAAGSAKSNVLDYVQDQYTIVVNGVFDQAELVYGAGSDKNTVRIARLSSAGKGPSLGSVVPAAPAPKSPSPPASKPLAAPAAPNLITSSGVQPPLPAQPPITSSTASAPAPVQAPAPIPVLAAKSAAPAVAAPVAAPAPAPKPLKTWNATVGSTLRQTVERWAAEEGWHVEWQPNDLDYPIEAALRFEGSFETAVREIFPLYDKASRSFKVSGSRPQKLLIISEK